MCVNLKKVILCLTDLKKPKKTERYENEIAFKAKKIPRHVYKWHPLKNYLLD